MSCCGWSGNEGWLAWERDRDRLPPSSPPSVEAAAPPPMPPGCLNTCYAHADGDCDDTDDSISPDAEEIPYDGIDNDCDEETLDDDLDGDGFACDWSPEPFKKIKVP